MHIQMTLSTSGRLASVRGREFEQITDHSFLEQSFGFTRHELEPSHSFLKTKTDTKTVYAMKQRTFLAFLHRMGKITSHLIPDEAYILFYSSPGSPTPTKMVVKIIEKKSQSVDGSVEEKLLCGPSYKEEYTQMFAMQGMDVTVEYAYCLNAFLAHKISMSNPKYIIRAKIRRAHNIECFDGTLPDYPEKIHEWIMRDPV